MYICHITATFSYSHETYTFLVFSSGINIKREGFIFAIKQAYWQWAPATTLNHHSNFLQCDIFLTETLPSLPSLYHMKCIVTLHLKPPTMLAPSPNKLLLAAASTAPVVPLSPPKQLIWHHTGHCALSLSSLHCPSLALFKSQNICASGKSSCVMFPCPSCQTSLYIVLLSLCYPGPTLLLKYTNTHYGVIYEIPSILSISITLLWF